MPELVIGKVFSVADDSFIGSTGEEIKNILVTVQTTPQEYRQTTGSLKPGETYTKGERVALRVSSRKGWGEQPVKYRRLERLTPERLAELCGLLLDEPEQELPVQPGQGIRAA